MSEQATLIDHLMQLTGAPFCICTLAVNELPDGPESDWIEYIEKNKLK